MERININSYTLIVILLFAFFGCSSDKNKNSAPIIVGYLPIIAHLPAFVAESEGYFEGLEVEFRVFPTSNDLMSSLRSGRIDIATTVATATYLSITEQEINNGNESSSLLFSVSRTGKNNPFDGVFIREDSDINDLSQLSGKRIGVFPGTTAERIFGYVLETEYGISKDSIQWIKLPPASQQGALESREIDILYTYETVRTIVSLGPFKKIHDSIVAMAQEDAPYGSSAVNRNFFNERNEDAIAFINAFDRGIQSIREHPNRARNILQARLRIPNSVRDNCNLEYRYKSDELIYNEVNENILEFIDLMNKIGELNNTSIDIQEILVK